MLSQLVSENYPVMPMHIDTSNHFWDTFGHNETEISARYLVRFAQKNGNWKDFTKKEIDTFSKQDFWFNKLISSKYIIENSDKTYSFTHEFISTCFLKNPLKVLI